MKAQRIRQYHSLSNENEKNTVMLKIHKNTLYHVNHKMKTIRFHTWKLTEDKKYTELKHSRAKTIPEQMSRVKNHLQNLSVKLQDYINFFTSKIKTHQPPNHIQYPLVDQTIPTIMIAH